VDYYIYLYLLLGADEIIWSYNILSFLFHDESDDGLLHLVNLAYEFYFVCVVIGILTMDFGCGSRVFSLPLVLLFLEHIFVCMDYKLEKHLITKSNTSLNIFVMFNSGDN
jgi:hypothetical protein